MEVMSDANGSCAVACGDAQLKHGGDAAKWELLLLLLDGGGIWAEE